MISLILSIILFAIVLTICYFGYISNVIQIEEIENEKEIANEFSEFLKYVYYKIIKKG